MKNNTNTKVVSEWGVNHKLKTAYSKVMKKVPGVGEVENKKNNPKLEKLRKASKNGYDLFNNGFMSAQFRRLFKVSAYDFPQDINRWRDSDWDEIEQVMEPVISKLIIEAYIEQFSSTELIAEMN